MPTHLAPFQPGTGSYSGISDLSSPPSALRAPPIDAQLEGDDVLWHTIHCHDQSPLVVVHPLTTDLGTLVDLARRFQPFLPSGYRWLGQEDLKVVGTRPIDAGGFADVWIGEVGDRKVAVKSYRCYTSADYIPTYNVGRP